MKGGIFFTGSGPIVVVTSYDSFIEPAFLEKLTAKGLDKFIAYEVAMDELKRKYGRHYDVIMDDLHQTRDLRVLDYDGHRVFNNFKLSKLRDPVFHESSPPTGFRGLGNRTPADQRRETNGSIATGGEDALLWGECGAKAPSF